MVFDLQLSASFGELVFMERYKEVLVELGRVEQKMQSQSRTSSSSSSEGLAPAAVPVAGRSRLGSSGLSTLQAIGSAAAAGSFFLRGIIWCSQFKGLKYLSNHLLRIQSLVLLVAERKCSLKPGLAALVEPLS